jgi:hypothetical protein
MNTELRAGSTNLAQTLSAAIRVNQGDRKT